MCSIILQSLVKTDTLHNTHKQINENILTVFTDYYSMRFSDAQSAAHQCFTFYYSTVVLLSITVVLLSIAVQI